MVGLWGSVLLTLVGLTWQHGEALRAYLWQANYIFLLWAGLTYLGALGCAAFIWATIMRSFEPSVSWWAHLEVYGATLAARRLPGTLWYVGGRFTRYQKLGIARSVVALASSMEMVAYFIAALLLTLGWWPWGQQGGWEWVGLSGLALMSLLAIHPAVLAWGMAYLQRPLQRRPLWRETLLWVGLSTSIWVLGGATLIELLSVFQPLTLAEQRWVMGAWMIAGLAGLLTIFLPSAFGIAELGLTVLISTQLPAQIVILALVLYRLITTALDVLVSLCIVLSEPLIRRVTSDQHAQPKA